MSINRTKKNREATQLSADTNKKGFMTFVMKFINWLFKLWPLEVGHLVIFIGAFCLLFFEQEQLFRIQELNLFQYSIHFLSGMMVVPGGFNSYLGCFLTQFFFFPVVGVAVWVIVMIILLGAIKKAFLIPNQWAILMGIPIILLLSEQMQQGYWIYYLKLKGFFYAPTCGDRKSVV